MHRRRARRAVGVLALAGLALGGLTACGDSSEEKRPAAASGTTAAPLPGSVLPGDEALTPPPVDPAVVEAPAAALNALGEGTARATVDLVLTGLVGFSEPATGTCAHGSDGSTVIDLPLSDGSRIDITASGEVAPEVRLTPPSGDSFVTDIGRVTHRLEGNSLALDATLLQSGTSNTAGTLSLDLTCGNA